MIADETGSIGQPISCDGQAEGSSFSIHLNLRRAAISRAHGVSRMAKEAANGSEAFRSGELRGYSCGSFHYPVDGGHRREAEIGPRWQLTTALTFVF